jgi:hypothetical protein
MSSHNTIIFASFDTKKFNDPESGFLNLSDNTASYLNIPPQSLTFTISTVPVNQDDYYIDFTTNGIDGFGAYLSAFLLPTINYAHQNIYFVAKVKSLSAQAPKKNYRKLEESFELLITQDDNLIITWNENDNILVKESALFLDLVLGDGTIVNRQLTEFTTNFGELTSNSGGGYLKAYFKTAQTGTGIRIKLIYQDEDSGLTLSGYSTPFNILPSQGEFDIRKVNEDNNQSQNFKDLRYQDILLDKPVLFDDFLGQIVGTSNTSVETLGIRNYEKTSNFVSNVADSEFANLKSLTNLFNELNIPFESYPQQFPPSLSRILDILSVGLTRQIGGVNQYQLNFNDKGYTGKTVFGKNKGDLLNINSALLYTGDQSRNIIALEKFSEEYTLLNTNILSATNIEYIDTNTYALSSYNNTWGWGLVLPNDVDGIGIKDYYEFYEFNNTIEGSLLQKFIDFDNINNTYLTDVVSFADYSDKWGIVESVISHNLYTNLNLISGS